MITRFAPSPTGLLHLGHAASAFQVWNAAAEENGTVLLRIEDTDEGRCRPDYEIAIRDDLAWLGLTWPEPVRRQSDHMDDYLHVLESLRARGLIYRCFRTRTEIAALADRAPHGLGPVFTGGPLSTADEAAQLEAGKAFAWRLSLQAARAALGDAYDRLEIIEYKQGAYQVIPADPAPLGDAVVARKDRPVSYHLASCHDDALQGVTDVIRGDDLREIAPLHALLQALMDWPRPRYRHHALIYGPDGKRLAKRYKSKTLAAMRADGLTPDDIRSLAGCA